jgi:hypothetical protein
MYVQVNEGVARDLGTVDLDRPAHLDHSYSHALGQPPPPTAEARAATSKCDVVGNPVILDKFDVGDHRLKPHHYDLLLELAAGRDELPGLAMQSEGWTGGTVR